MGYAVLHIKKRTGSGSGFGNHIDRIKGKEYSYKNADPEKLKTNKFFKINRYTDMKLTNAIEARISDGYKSNRKIRTDGVKYCTAILSGSHDDMIRISKNPDLFNKWISSNLNFAKESWGAENIVRFNLHLDEKTPHIHCVFVPITETGRLSAREVIGNKKKLQSTQRTTLYKRRSQTLPRLNKKM